MASIAGFNGTPKKRGNALWVDVCVQYVER